MADEDVRAFLATDIDWRDPDTLDIVRGLCGALITRMCRDMSLENGQPLDPAIVNDLLEALDANRIPLAETPAGLDTLDRAEDLALTEAMAYGYVCNRDLSSEP